MADEKSELSAFRTRLLIAPLLLLFIAGIYWLDIAGAKGVASAVLLGTLGLLGVLEYSAMLRKADFPVSTGKLFLAALLLHSSPFFFATWDRVDSELYPALIITSALLFAVSVTALSRARMHEGLEEMGAVLLGFLLICMPLFLAQGLALRSVEALLYLVLVAKGGDIAGYLVGVSLGRRKLIPHVSPGKSVEGAIGSLVASALLALFLRDSLLPDGPQAKWQLIVLGVGINVLAQSGDLVESLLKRRCDTKDSSRFLPVHGGILDLIDSFLFSFPVFFFLFVRWT